MLKIYQCEKCKEIVLSKVGFNCDGWKELIPGSTDAAQEKHVPVVTKKCKTVKVDVGTVAHPMTSEHFIEWVALETEQGYQIKYLTPEATPAVTFTLADGDKAVAVYAYCNLHGLWKV